MTYNSLEWLDGNMACSFPLNDRCDGVSRSGVPLPTSFLVDLAMIVPAQGDENFRDRFFISKLLRSISSFTVVIGFAGSTTFDCAYVRDIPIGLQYTPDITARTFQIQPSEECITAGYTSMYDMNGQVIIGTCRDMMDIGTLTFDYDHAALLGAHILSPAWRYAELMAANSPAASYGGATGTTEIVIQEGNGISVSNSGTNVTISLDMSNEDAQFAMLTKTQMRNQIISSLGNPIQSINGVHPDNKGNIDINEGAGVSISAAEHSLTINNTASVPCCTETTTDVQTAVEQLEASVEKMMAYYEALSNGVNTLQSKLASVIGGTDNG